jgi:hypothetical protein
MGFLLKSFLAVVLIVASTGVILRAQTVRSYFRPMGSLATMKETFSSTEGRYSIGLPKQIGGFSEGTFQWRLLEGYFTVGYADSGREIESSPDAATQISDSARTAILDFNRWLLEPPPPQAIFSSRPFNYDGHRGVELRAEMANGLALARAFSVKKRIYALAVILVGDQRNNEVQALRVFDSFKLERDSDADAKLRQMIADATPKELPQDPVAPNPKTDAEDENLKGRVKATVQEIEATSGRMVRQGRRLSGEDFYNEQGNRIRRVTYNSAGLPFSITVYGYIDGKRVSKSGDISYESSPPPMVAPLGPRVETKPRDPRYSISYVYKYGADGKRSETELYRNDGALLGRTVYKRSDKELETLRYSEDGRLNSRTHAALDDKGNEIEVTHFDVPLKGAHQVYRYSYEFDTHGNWIKRITTFVRIIGGVERLDSTYVTHRRITYY